MYYSIWLTISILSIIALCCGAILGYVTRKLSVVHEPIIMKIDDLLPQTQCGQCGYPGCLPYAQAICKKGEHIDKCVPGGNLVTHQLAQLLAVPLPEKEYIAAEDNTQKKAIIDELNCIGCTKCIQVCPVDAIVGTGKHMHTVLSELCTGCELCIAPCPTDCIRLYPAPVMLHESMKQRSTELLPIIQKYP